MKSLTPHQVGSRELKNRIIFGPHRTNLSHDRTLGDASLAYYNARISGGVGMLITEDLSVDPSDWPYEYAPEIQRSLPTLSLVAQLSRQHGTALVASLNHSGAEGSSAYSQRVLLAPSDEVDVDAMEPPKEMESYEIDLIKAAFRTAAINAVNAGVMGVEINVAQRSLLRQFLSSLTNHRADSYGLDRSLLIRETLTEVRQALGSGPLVGVRLCVDERASWGGINLDTTTTLLGDIATLIDYVVVTSGSGFSKYLYRPDFHEPTAFNLGHAQVLHERSHGRSWTLALQGSITSIEIAEQALSDGSCELIEMTRALICDPELIPRSETAQGPRPCIACNQGCLPQDTRNINVSCLINPQSGWEHSSKTGDSLTLDELGLPDRALQSTHRGQQVHIVGAGICGLELALNLHAQGITSINIYDTDGEAGGLLRALAGNRFAGRFRDLLAYYLASLSRSAIRIHRRSINDLSDCDAIQDGDIVALCYGAQPTPPSAFRGAIDDQHWIDTASIYRSPERASNKTVVLVDEVGSTESIATAEILLNAGATLHIVTPDPVFGSRASSTGDLVPSLQRIRSQNCTLHTASRFTFNTSEKIEGRLGGVISPTFGHQKQIITFDLIAEVGRRESKPIPSNQTALEVRTFRLGDALAPRTISEAILESQRCATTITEMLKST